MARQTKIDYSQKRTDHVHVHPYDPELLREVREDMMQPRTCREFIEWLDTHPHYDVAAEASSQYLTGTKQDDAYKVIGQVHTDWQSINEDVEKYAQEKRLDEEFETAETDQWRVYDLDEEQTDFKPFRHTSELENQHKHGFDKQYQLIEVTIADAFKRLKQLDEVLEMKFSKTDINYQPTSGMFPRHVDFLATGWKRAIEAYPELGDMMYDPVLKSPRELQLKRWLIPLNDWQPGHMFYFEEHGWKNWKKGQIIDFCWEHCRHATANSGYVARPLVKITGFIDDNHWSKKGEFREFEI